MFGGDGGLGGQSREDVRALCVRKWYTRDQVHTLRIRHSRLSRQMDIRNQICWVDPRLGIGTEPRQRGPNGALGLLYWQYFLLHIP